MSILMEEGSAGAPNKKGKRDWISPLMLTPLRIALYEIGR